MDATKFRFVGNDIKTFPSTGIGEVAETTSEWYYHMLNAVPSLKQLSNAFICGEPHDMIPSKDDPTKMVPVHRLCYQHEERFFSVLIPIYANGEGYDCILCGIKAIMHEQPCYSEPPKLAIK